MPSLGEFLGGLLADAARARVQGDVEAVRIAQAYSQDPLLKHLPVPRFRMPDITVDVPVLVLEFRGTDSLDGRSVDKPTSAELRAALRAALRDAGIRVSRAATSRIPTDFIERTQELFDSETLRLNLAAGVDQIVRVLIEIVQANVEPALSAEQVEQLRKSTSDAISALLATRIRPSLSWQVAVTAAEIKAHEDTGSIVRLRMTISEDSYEIVDRDEGRGFLLTPE